MGIKVGVVGAGGRMGRTICNAVSADAALEFVAAIDPRSAGQDVNGVTVAAGLDALVAAGAEVVIDFTVLDAARSTVPWLAANGIHGVIGTTGFSPEDLESFRAVFTTSNCIVASNFAVSAVLMMRFAELAAPYFETAEIIELHHEAKLDAPSGTAMLTAERMAQASGHWLPDATDNEILQGSRGGRGPGEIRVHSVRLRGMVAHQEVILGTTGQTLSIRHDSYDRDSFMPGVLLAVKAVADRPGLTIGLDELLDL